MEKPPPDKSVSLQICGAKPKKPYQPPRLIKLGSLQEVTKQVGYRGQSDGGRFPRGFRTAY